MEAFEALVDFAEVTEHQGCCATELLGCSTQARHVACMEERLD